MSNTTALGVPLADEGKELFVVYGTHNGDGVVRYVGITSRGARQRLLQHLGHARTGRLNRPMYVWLRTCLDTADVILLESCDDQESMEVAERRWIASLPDLLNQTVGGNRGTRHSDESRAKMSAWHLEHPRLQTLEHTEAVRRTWTGRHHTDEARAKIREKRALQVRGPQTDKQKEAARQGQLRRWEAWRVARDS